MNLVSSAAQVRQMDRRVIDGLGLPGIALMELAAKAVAEAVRREPAARRGVVVVCGGGNNGGDGYGVARWLDGWGLPVEVWPLKEALTGDAAIQRDACRAAGVTFRQGIGTPGLVVDAVFGTGLTRPVEGRYREAIEAMAGLPVVAVDLPSGLHADTGAVLGVAVQAVRTVTFGRLKPGLLGEPGADLAGEVEVADIGLGAGDAVAEVPDREDLTWPRRARGAHKSAHLYVVAGSEDKAGAAVLVCLGALAAGAGLVTLVAHRRTLPRLAALPPEVMVSVVDGTPSLARAEAVAAGPGLGDAPWLQHLWETSGLPLVYDADALPYTAGGAPAPRLVTPHPGEAGRLLGCSAAEVQADRFAAAVRLASDGKVALLKGRNTLVAEEGRRTSVNPTSSPVLATGGTGDVLTGVLGALLARGCSARDAARLGAWVHGRAGQLLEAERSQGWTAGDVARAIPRAIEELRKIPTGAPGFP